MPPETSPTMRRRRLGQELRRLRDQAGVSAEAAAAELDCSLAKIRHIEGGRNAPRKPELTALVSLYGASDDVHSVLEEIRKEASRPGWWSTYRLPTWLQTYVGMEVDATKLCNFELELIPGLLQTEAYARAVHARGKHMTEPQEVDKRVAARMRRQERLTGDDPLRYSAVISEAALRRASGAEWSAGQFRHLITMAQRPNVSIQILPFSAGLHPSMSGSFVVMDFARDVSLPVAYQEYAVGGHLVDDPASVTKLTDLFEDLREQALSEEESGRFLQEWI